MNVYNECVHTTLAVLFYRRTYIGSMPGRIVQGLRTVQVTNPVFLLDEVDKLVSMPSCCGFGYTMIDYCRTRESRVTQLLHYWRSLTLSKITPSLISTSLIPPLVSLCTLLSLYSSYLNIPYDLSQVLFIATANTTSTIPPALLDRMEVQYECVTLCHYTLLCVGYHSTWLYTRGESGDCISSSSTQADGGE